MVNRLTRKQKRTLRNGNHEETNLKLNFQLKNIDPLTVNQRITFDKFKEGKHLLLHGVAGTGKSFLSIYLAMQSVLVDNSRYNKVVIVRSVVPTRDMGFLPGNNKEKSKVYEGPYNAIFTELFERGDAYEYLKTKNIVEFISTSFLRGITLSNCIVVVDEIQNMTSHELDSVITRLGPNCRIIFCGDLKQSDFTKDQDKAGLWDFMKILEKMRSFDKIEFGYNDIVRSNLVREYIIAKDSLNLKF